MDERRPKAGLWMKPRSSLRGDKSVGDRISELPDGVLGSILFLLPLKEAGRTTVLSKRWRGVFAHSPIALDDRDLGRHPLGSGVGKHVLRADRMSAITQILAAHKGPIRRVRLEVARFQGDKDGNKGIDPMAFATRGVEELIVRSTTYPIQFFPAPPLRSVQLLSYRWLYLEPSVAPIFSHIKELSLCAVHITDDEVSTLLERCVVLESLQLCSYQEDGEGVLKSVTLHIDKLQVLSQTLRSLDLDIAGLEEVLVRDTPNLERLLGGVRYGSFCRVTLYKVPKLRIVGFLTFSNNFDPAPVMGLWIPGLYAPIHSVKKLGLCVDVSFVSHVHEMLEVLKSFPSLETLHIKIPAHENEIHELQDETAYAKCLELVKSVDCLGRSVKTVVISDELWFSDCCTDELAGLLLEVTKNLKVVKMVSASSERRSNYIEDDNWRSFD